MVDIDKLIAEIKSDIVNKNVIKIGKDLKMLQSIVSRLTPQQVEELTKLLLEMVEKLPLSTASMKIVIDILSRAIDNSDESYRLFLSTFSKSLLKESYQHLWECGLKVLKTSRRELSEAVKIIKDAFRNNIKLSGYGIADDMVEFIIDAEGQKSVAFFRELLDSTHPLQIIIGLKGLTLLKDKESAPKVAEILENALNGLYNTYTVDEHAARYFEATKSPDGIEHRTFN